MADLRLNIIKYNIVKLLTIHVFITNLYWQGSQHQCGWRQQSQHLKNLDGLLNPYLQKQDLLDPALIKRKIEHSINFMFINCPRNFNHVSLTEKEIVIYLHSYPLYELFLVRVLQYNLQYVPLSCALWCES